MMWSKLKLEDLRFTLDVNKIRNIKQEFAYI